jgi:hypothetical protein
MDRLSQFGAVCAGGLDRICADMTAQQSACLMQAFAIATFGPERSVP